MSETITLAAINHEGHVYTGPRHFLIIQDIIKTTGTRKVGGNSIQGFVTNTGRFVDREEAAKIALAAGQIAKLKYSSVALFSEEIIAYKP